MTRVESVTRFEQKLNEALRNSDWEWADRCSERLRMLLLEAVVVDDSDAIARVESALADAGEMLELSRRLNMAESAEGAAWRLRSDAGTATLALRIKPLKPKLPLDDDGSDVKDCIVKVIRSSRRPLSNKDLAAELDRDPALISRTLKYLNAHGLVRQWRVGRRVLNALTDKGKGISIDPVANLVRGREEASSSVANASKLPSELVASEITESRVGRAETYWRGLSGVKIRREPEEIEHLTELIPDTNNASERLFNVIQ